MADTQGNRSWRRCRESVGPCRRLRQSLLSRDNLTRRSPSNGLSVTAHVMSTTALAGGRSSSILAEHWSAITDQPGRIPMVRRYSKSAHIAPSWRGRGFALKAARTTRIFEFSETNEPLIDSIAIPTMRRRPAVVQRLHCDLRNYVNSREPDIFRFFTTLE